MATEDWDLGGEREGGRERGRESKRKGDERERGEREERGREEREMEEEVRKKNRKKERKEEEEEKSKEQGRKWGKELELLMDDLPATQDSLPLFTSISTLTLEEESVPNTLVTVQLNPSLWTSVEVKL